MAVTEELLNHILALLPILWPQNSKNKLHFGRRERLTTRCHELLHKAESLPEYGSSAAPMMRAEMKQHLREHLAARSL